MDYMAIAKRLFMEKLEKEEIVINGWDNRGDSLVLDCLLHFNKSFNVFYGDHEYCVNSISVTWDRITEPLCIKFPLRSAKSDSNVRNIEDYVVVDVQDVFCGDVFQHMVEGFIDSNLRSIYRQESGCLSDRKNKKVEKTCFNFKENLIAVSEECSNDGGLYEGGRRIPNDLEDYAASITELCSG